VLAIATKSILLLITTTLAARRQPSAVGKQAIGEQD
jgi:hypothetical protein